MTVGAHSEQSFAVSGEQLIEQLRDGCTQLDLNLNPVQYQQLVDYVLLFQKWNQAYNLSAIRDPLQIVSRHLLDSLSIARHLQGKNFIDVGTGGGLPGIPLAITFPDYHFVLLDSNGKKTRFLFQVKQDLNLSNVDVVQSRVEQYRAPHLFDGVISRAFASLNDMLIGSRHLLADGGCWYAMKGQKPEAELAAIANDHFPEKHVVQNCVELHVPNNAGERHLIIINKASDQTQSG